MKHTFIRISPEGNVYPIYRYTVFRHCEKKSIRYSAPDVMDSPAKSDHATDPGTKKGSL